MVGRPFAVGVPFLFVVVITVTRDRRQYTYRNVELAMVRSFPHNNKKSRKIEKLKIEKSYDLVLFSESFQYVNIKNSLTKIPSLLNQNGSLLICDFFRHPGTGTKPLGGGHDWNVFQDNLKNYSFTNLIDIDITKETARTYDLINKLIEDVAVPVRELSSNYLSSQYPRGMRFLKWYFDKKISRMNRIYFSGNMTGEMFNKLKTYRILLYKT